MRKIQLSIAALFFTVTTYAQESPLWLRNCAIAPDGTTIAFTYKGDIYTVPTTGGRALQITTNPAYDTAPVWSPDSKQIAFASDRMGSLDVFLVSKDGGEPCRLTTHSGSETPVAFSDHACYREHYFPFQRTVQTNISGLDERRASCPVFVHTDGAHFCQQRWCDTLSG